MICCTTVSGAGAVCAKAGPAARATASAAMRIDMDVLLLGGDVIAELDRVGDRLEGLEAGADATHQDVAVTQNAPEDRLVDVDTLDLVHVHLDGFAADEALLVDDAAVGDGDLGGPAPEPGDQQCGDPGRHHGERQEPDRG